MSIDPKAESFSLDDEDLQAVLVEGSDAEVDKFLAIVREPADLAECLLLIRDEERRRTVFRRLPEERRAEVLAELEGEDREVLLVQVSSADVARLADQMDSDDAADLLGELPPERQTEVLEKFPDAEDREEVRRLLDYPEDSAGGIMQAELIAVPQTATATDAIAAIRDEFEDVGDINVLFVTDEQGRHLGQVPLVRLLVMSPAQRLSDVVDRDVPVVGVLQDQEEVAHLFGKYDLVAAAVVDDEGRIVGRITIDDVVDVIEEEAEEDILHTVGADEVDVHGSLLRMSGARLGWLAANCAGGLLAAWFISIFETQLEQSIALVAFIPVIMALGGSMGIQTTTITIRGWATGRIRSDNARTAAVREVGAGAIIGTIAGVVLAAFAWLWKGDSDLGAVVGVAIFIAVVVAAGVGAVLPALFRRLRIDPALASGPIVTTLNDTVGILIYFLIATAVLSRLA